MYKSGELLWERPACGLFVRGQGALHHLSLFPVQEICRRLRRHLVSQPPLPLFLLPPPEEDEEQSRGQNCQSSQPYHRQALHSDTPLAQGCGLVVDGFCFCRRGSSLSGVLRLFGIQAVSLFFRAAFCAASAGRSDLQQPIADSSACPPVIGAISTGSAAASLRKLQKLLKRFLLRKRQLRLCRRGL